MERALETLELYAHFCRATGIDDVRPVATSAIRDAANQAAFLKAARERSGLEVEVLSREEEARYGYLAAVNSTTLSDGVVLDLGGGSMQLTRVEDRRGDRRALVAAGRRAHDRALPARGRQAKASRSRRCASTSRRSSRRAAWLGRRRAAGRASAARSATSPPRRSSPPGCRPTASRASASRATRWTS